MKYLKTSESYIKDLYSKKENIDQDEKDILQKVKKMRKTLKIEEDKLLSNYTLAEELRQILIKEYFKILDILPFEESKFFYKLELKPGLKFNDKFCITGHQPKWAKQNYTIKSIRFKKSHKRESLINIVFDIDTQYKETGYDPWISLNNLTAKDKFHSLNWIHDNYPEYFEGNKLGLI